MSGQSDDRVKMIAVGNLRRVANLIKTMKQMGKEGQYTQAKAFYWKAHGMMLATVPIVDFLSSESDRKILMAEVDKLTELSRGVTEFLRVE